jgi:hypothetical protein
MSSIMDELKTLQGNRAFTGRPGRSQGEPGAEPESAGPMCCLVRARRPSHAAVVLALSGALAVLLALLVVHGAGGPARGAVRPVVAAAAERPKESAPVVQAEVAADAAAAAQPEAEAHTGGGWAPLLAGLIERAKVHSDVVAATDPQAGVEPEGHTEGWWAPLLAGLIERATMHSDVVAVHTQLEEPEAESVAVVGSESLEIASAEPVEAPLPKPPVRILTLEEDEANKAAIRELKVFGVLADEQGVGVYTSEGELRAGGQFRAMQVTEVTLRSVLFECGNKRYRWLLPH